MSDIVELLIARAEKARRKGLPLEATEPEIAAYCAALGLTWPRGKGDAAVIVWGVPVRVVGGPR